MESYNGIGSYVPHELGRHFTVSEHDLGDDALITTHGIKIATRTFGVEGVGHLCLSQMQAPFGLMYMQTIVLAPTEVDAPLLNIDLMRVAGTPTQMAELYDLQLTPLPEAVYAEFEKLFERFSHLNTAPAEPHWYDEIRYPFSIHTKGADVDDLRSFALDYASTYIALLTALPTCDRVAKEARVRAFADRLFAEGGISVKTMRQLLGEERARHYVRTLLYGVRDDGAPDEDEEGR